MRIVGLLSALLVVSVTASAANNTYDDREMIESALGISNKLMVLIPQRNVVGDDRRSITNKDLASELNELKAILRSVEKALLKQKDADEDITQHRNTMKGYIRKLLGEVDEYKKLGLAIYSLRKELDRLRLAEPPGG